MFVACGSLDRLSHGILWPITKTNNRREAFCSDVNPSFAFGPVATRTCRADGTWSGVDTSQCTINHAQSTFVIYSTYTDTDNINTTDITSPEIEMVS